MSREDKGLVNQAVGADSAARYPDRGGLLSSGNPGARYVLALIMGARRGPVSERTLRRESFADRQRRA